MNHRKISPISLADKVHACGQLLAKHDAAESRTPEIQFDAARRVGPRHFEVDAVGVGRETRGVLVKISARDAGQFQADGPLSWTTSEPPCGASPKVLSAAKLSGKRPRR